jgi:hypothetical protein
MTKRLKQMTTLAAIGATFALAAPAQAAQDSGNGKTRRCEAAQNGKHNGFDCEAFVDDRADGSCARGYERVPAPIYATTADANGNTFVCRPIGSDA